MSAKWQCPTPYIYVNIAKWGCPPRHRKPRCVRPTDIVTYMRVSEGHPHVGDNLRFYTGDGRRPIDLIFCYVHFIGYNLYNSVIKFNKNDKAFTHHDHRTMCVINWLRFSQTWYREISRDLKKSCGFTFTFFIYLYLLVVNLLYNLYRH